VAQATAPLADYAVDVKNEPLILTTSGKLVAALVPLENADVETVTLSTHPHFLAVIERSRTRQKWKGGSPMKRCVVGWEDRKRERAA